jgi:hypothetical protein
MMPEEVLPAHMAGANYSQFISSHSQPPCANVSTVPFVFGYLWNKNE